ncbi:MAG TPA: hypothetical protein VK990_10170 [Acidimicrobiia bacterium]|nr:hypothetical protein [Acidimicrobiia bacterium]
MSKRTDAYLRKLRTYLAPRYWKLVVSVHGARGVPREIVRIFTPTRKTVSPAAATEHIDFSDRTTDPERAMVLAAERGPDVTAMVRVPMSSLRRSHLGVAIADPGANPFTRAVADYLSGKCTVYVDSVLPRFYDDWRPTTLAEFVGLDVDQDSPLSRPLVVGVLPWEPARAMDELFHERDAYELDRLAKFGPAPEGTHGYDYFGPTSHALGEYRFNKHCRVAASIAEDGYDPSDHIIEVQLMAGEGAWALLVRDGKHRTIAMAALGVDSVRVSLPRVYPVIRRSEVETWPGVVSGLYQVEEALRVFDRFVEGRASYPTSFLQSVGAPQTNNRADTVPHRTL